MFCTAVATSRPSRVASSISSWTERVRPRAQDRQDPDRPGPEQERRDDPRAQAELGQLHLLRVEVVAEVSTVDRLGSAHDLLDQRASRHRRPGVEHLVVPDAGCGHHVHVPFVGEDDRGPVERDQPLELPDERSERLVELERRAERPSATVRCLEQVGAAAELVAKVLGRPGLRGRRPRLGSQKLDQPADDQCDHHLDPELQRDVLEPEPVVEPVVTHPFEHGHAPVRRRRRDPAPRECRTGSPPRSGR